MNPHRSSPKIEKFQPRQHKELTIQPVFNLQAGLPELVNTVRLSAQACHTALAMDRYNGTDSSSALTSPLAGQTGSQVEPVDQPLLDPKPKPWTAQRAVSERDMQATTMLVTESVMFQNTQHPSTRCVCRN